MKKWVSLLIAASMLILPCTQMKVYAEEESGFPAGRQYLAEENIGNALVTADVTFDENDEIILGDELDISSIPMPTATEGEICKIIPHAQTLWYGNWSTCKFDVGTSTGTSRGYCAQPQTPTPSGYYTVSKIDGSTEMGKKLKIALMFGENGPWYGESTALFGGCSWNAVYAYLHAMISIIYSNQTNGLTSSQIQALNAAINEQYNERGNLSDLNAYTVYVAYNDKQDIVWLENVPDLPPKSPEIELKIIKKKMGTEQTIPGTVFRHTFSDGTMQEVSTDEKGQVILKEVGVGQHTIEEIFVPDGFVMNPGKIVFEVSKDGNVAVLENTATEMTGNMTWTMESTESAVLTVEDKVSPYGLQLVKVNDQNLRLRGAEFVVYEDVNCTQEKARAVTDENGNCFFQDLEVGKSYYLKEVKAPQGYRIFEENGNPVVYEIKAESNPVENVFECYINGEKNTEIGGTKAERMVVFTLVNYCGVEMPETGTHTRMIVFICGAGCMSMILLYSMKKRKDKKTKNEKEF